MDRTDETDMTRSELGYMNALRLTGSLIHLVNRAYDAEAKVFVQSDVVDRLRYTYTGGDPINRSDPTGLEAIEDPTTTAGTGAYKTTVVYQADGVTQTVTMEDGKITSVEATLNEAPASAQEKANPTSDSTGLANDDAGAQDKSGTGGTRTDLEGRLLVTMDPDRPHSAVQGEGGRYTVVNLWACQGRGCDAVRAGTSYAVEADAQRKPNGTPGPRSAADISTNMGEGRNDPLYRLSHELDHANRGRRGEVIPCDIIQSGGKPYKSYAREEAAMTERGNRIRASSWNPRLGEWPP